MALVLSWNCWMENMIVIGMGHEGIFRLNWEKGWSTGPGINQSCAWCTVSGMVSFLCHITCPSKVCSCWIRTSLCTSALRVVGVRPCSCQCSICMSWLQCWLSVCHSVLTSGPYPLLYQLHLGWGLAILTETVFCSLNCNLVYQNLA